SGCYPILCSDKNQILPCICSGHINRDTPDCICIGQTHQETGLREPAFCGLYAGFCICGGIGGFNPDECVCDGSIDQPDNCKSALTVVINEGLCTGGTNIDPYPENCQLQQCESSEQTAPCICNEELDKNRPDCMCQAATGASVDQRSCICGINHHPTGCICSSSSDSGCICSSILENNPNGCICSTTIDSNPPSCSIQDCSSSFGESVTIDSCYCTKTNYPTGCKLGLCKGIDDYPQCLCSDVSNEPETCTLDVCKSNLQQYPCICTGTPVDTPTCICSQQNEESLTIQGSCTCGINHHPTGCICSSNTDKDCLCSSTLATNPSDCICSTIIDQNPSSCIIQDCRANSDTTVTIDSCYCTKTNHPSNCKPMPCKGINDYPQYLCSDVDNEPETCTPVVCKNSSKQYPCICTGTNADTSNCICSQQNEESLTIQGSCTCGINHHPTGCICSSSTDSGCICSSILENNPNGCICSTTIDSNPDLCTVIDCKANSGTTVTKGSCVCTGTNHPSGCECPTGSAQLAGIPAGQCSCLPSSDIRQECKVNILACASDTVPPEGCICTGTYHPDRCT
ncbi:MAG: hypothetical protein EZS28_019465, partial [Streblomastix strix]